MQVVESFDYPYPYTVIDNFFPDDVALRLESEFPPYHDPAWYVYRNALENKKTMNYWHLFPPETYRAFQSLCQKNVYGAVADYGLHGGGWHISADGGNLNPHCDYQLHPKLGMHRRFNIIVYLSSDYKEEYGGEFGLWDGDDVSPGKLVKKIWPKFNRGILFDVSGNAWHGMASKVSCPTDIYRKSIAVYYVGEGQGDRKKALFAPREGQEGVEDLIKRRAQGEYK